MSPTNAKIGFGALFKIESLDSPNVMITVGEITSIKPPSVSRDAVDATHSESPEGWREFIAGLKDGGEASVDLNFVPGGAGITMLLRELGVDTVTACAITLPTTPAYSWTFDAILTGFEPDIPIDDKMSATATFKVTGKPVLAVSA